MSRGAPDWTRAVQVNIAAGQALSEDAAGGAGTYSGVATTYQTVVTWTVTAAKTGELKEILLLTSNYAKTLIKVVIGTVTWCTGFAPQYAMPMIFEDLRLAAATVVTVSAKSSDGTAIVVDAIITAKEVG